MACRYFVQTAALFTIGLEHAAAYWKGLHGALGERLKLTDEASALARADASEGIHYSFEKPDQVTCSTVQERLLTFDSATYRGELVSFSIAEASVEAAREHIELLEVAEEEDAEEDMLQARSAAMEVAAAQAQAEDAAKVKGDARYARVSAAREAGKELQRQREQQKKQRRSRVHVYMLTDVPAQYVVR